MMMRYLYAIVIAILVFSSCQEEEIPETDEPVKSGLGLIKITGHSNSPQTKTTLSGLTTTWESLDKVGIYCAQAKLSGGAVGVKNAEFTVVSGSLSPEFTGTIFWGAGLHYFYAYYPYNAANSSLEATAIPIALTDAQTQNGSAYSHIGDIDFLVATPKTSDPMVDGAETPVDLTYNHVFSMIEFKVLIPWGTTKFNRVEITTSSANNLSLTSGSIDITQAKPTGDVPYTISDATGSGTSTLDITGDCIITNDPATTAGAMMMVLPGDHIGSSFTVNAHTDLGVTTVTGDGVNIKRNNKYNLTITIPFIDLKTAARFGILSGVGITGSESSIIHDMDVGISPGLRAAITNFPPATVVNGAIYAPDDVAPPCTADALIQAKNDLTAAYLVAEAANTPTPVPVAGDLGSQILTPGIYKSTSTLSIQSGDLTLDAQGNSNAFWVFQIANDFTTIGGGGGNVLLINGAQAKNVFWQVGTSATIGNNTSFKGNILALTSITMNPGAMAEGRMLAQNGAIVLPVQYNQ